MRNIIFFIVIFVLIMFFSCQKDHYEISENTFLYNLPDSVKNKVLWFCDYEDKSFYKWEGKGTNTQYAGGGIFVTDKKNTDYGFDKKNYHSGKFAAFMSIKNALYPGQNKAIRFMRWTDKPWNKGGDYFPDKAYYSTFLMFKETYNPEKNPENDPNRDGGWWNIFQFKSKNNIGSMPIVSLDLYNQNGKMYLGLVIKDYPDDNSENYNFQYIMQENPLPIEINQWTHIEMYYEKSKSYNGKVIVWQNNIKIFEKENIRTVLPPDETAVWGIGNYTDYITGGQIDGSATIYFDDAIVSTKKISDYIDIN